MPLRILLLHRLEMPLRKFDQNIAQRKRCQELEC
jgi:hypothetical protein